MGSLGGACHAAGPSEATGTATMLDARPLCPVAAMAMMLCDWGPSPPLLVFSRLEGRWFPPWQFLVALVSLAGTQQCLSRKQSLEETGNA